MATVNFVAKSLLRPCRRAVRVALDRWVDRYFGIDTVSGAMALAPEPSRFGDVKVNGPVSYWLLYRYVGRKRFAPEDVFYDIGCGHGRVLCFVARQRVAKCVGVEISPAFAARAEANGRRLRGRLAPIEVRVGDAADMDYEAGTVFFLGDPFGHLTLSAVLDSIRRTLVSQPRRIRFIFWIPTYVEPSFEEVIRSTGWLSFAGVRKDFYSPFRAEFWTHEPLTTPLTIPSAGRTPMLADAGQGQCEP